MKTPMKTIITFILTFIIVLGGLFGAQNLKQDINLGAALRTFLPSQGGTGISAAPTYGQILVGNQGGTYNLTATSSLGILSGGSINSLTHWTSSSELGATTSPTINYLTATDNSATSTFAGNTYIKGNLQIDGNFFAPVILQASSDVNINGALTVTGQTTLSTSLTGVLSASSGVVSAGTLGASDISLTKGYFIVGDDAGTAQATSTMFISSIGNIGIGTTTPAANLHISGTDTEMRITDIGDSEYTRITRTDTSKKAIRYNRTTKPGSTYTISNLVAQWKMNDNAANTTVAELGGLYNGVLNVNTDTKTIAGKIDTALDFNGSADFVEVTDPNIGTANTFTVCAWVYPTDTTYRNVISYGNDGANRGWRLTLTGGGKARWGNALSQFIDSVATIPLNQWTFICVQIRTGWSDLNIYINGVYDNQNHGGDTIAPNSTDDFRIGKVWDADQSGSTNYFLGRIDDVRYYNKVLSDTDISKIYNNGNGTDEQGLNTASVVETDVWSSQDGVLAAEEGIQTYGHGLGRTVINGGTIRFNIGGVEKANIDASGNLGIGVATAAARLHTLSTTEQLRLGYDASNYWSGTVGATGGLTLAGVGTGGALSLTPTAGQNVNISLSGAGDLAINTNQLYVDTSAGNVGIGTTTPYSKLSVWGSGTGTSRLFELTNSASTTLASFLDNGTGYFLGNVGIGTTNPLATLHMVGGFLATASSTVSGLLTATNASTTNTSIGTWLSIPNSANPTVGVAGTLAIDTTAASSSLRFHDGTAERSLYSIQYKSFTVASSTWLGAKGATASSTIPLAVASVHGETWTEITCYTDSAGTAQIEFGDGTNWMDYQLLTTTALTDSSLSNNTFTTYEKRYVRIGQTATNPDYITCSVGVREDAN